ncbi:SusC/RagA family TonB-linked outer membrane protein [Christiangramia sp.]|uniref:SusC/RagA family TonB-linked outer membrane protein n=1 Tax=Christiangramia sp. TaxID=1931228 RepID=UPI002613486B|nr:SusC/RagA family TonB-linked outer membrane protein [Christiangramia sp.]
MKKRLKSILVLFAVLIVHISSAQQEKTITGTVIDGDGLPLPGVNVLVKNTNRGVQTDFDGNYTIQAAEGEVLVFSFLGLSTGEYTVGDTSIIDVVMEAGESQLDEVVVTALGIERKPKELSYSVSSLDEEELTNTKSVNAATAMIGKVSGLQINTTNNGVNPNTRVVLRGNRSLLGNNEALIVVDGFPAPRGVLDQINPNDIKEMTILKGANASALYGSDAANGVIVITTKKGNGKLTVTYNTNYEQQSVAYLPEFQDEFGPGGFPDGTFYPLENVNWGPRFDGRPAAISEVLLDGSVLEAPYSPIENRNENFFDTGSTIRHGITIGGGDEKGDLLLSVDHTNTKGIIPKDRYNRTNFRVKGSRTYENLTIGGNVSFFRSHRNIVGNGGRQGRPVYWNVLNTPLNVPLTELKDWRTGRFTRNEVSFFRFYENPYFIIDTQRWKYDSSEFIALADINYKFNEWINATIRVGHTVDVNEFKQEFGAYTYAFRLPDAYANGIPEYGASTADNLNTSSRTNSDFLLNFNREIADNFSANLTLGHNLRIQSFRRVNVSGQDLIIPDFYNVSTRTGNLEGGEFSSQYRKMGVYGDLTLGYSDFLFLNATARNDWSSTLSQENRSFFYPGVGISFIPTEAFPQLIGDQGISYLKFSANITKTGNDPGVYQNASTFFAPQESFAGNPGTGFFPYGSTPGLSQSGIDRDPDLSPEFTTSKEAGIEFGFFKNRFTGNVTVYQTNSTDQIIPVNISLASGASSRIINIGEVENRGLEVDFNARILQTDDFSWKIGGNYSGFKSEVKSLAEGVDQLSIGGIATAEIVARVGEPFPLLSTTAYERDDEGRVVVGANGNPIQAGGNEIMGKTVPDYVVGVNTNITFKNFNLYAVADYRTGHVFYNNLVNALRFTGLAQHSASSNRQPFVFPNSSYADGNGGFVENTNRPTTSGGFNFFNGTYGSINENYVTDATVLKLREVLLSYNFGGDLLNTLNLQTFSLGLYGRNLLTIRPAENVYTDPEFNRDTSNANEIGFGTQTQSPPTRQYGITLTAKF